ncbi:spore Coat Protein U domain protein [Collimonas arenae]|uniref:spore coat protein U domain-containing protein n=1 Tax=Collimonas arenae TaxID=279058 RepID=UPI00078D6E99|nr:spore coat protein U domain-containing protein [Collimonas arenae]AMP00619.1 spore Coat Protein U domain protein [Collimonas arenae]
MTNTVTIAANCSISTLGFTTTYDPVVVNATANQDVTASVTTTCTVGASPVVTLGQGANANTGSTDAVPLRRLSSAAARPAISTTECSPTPAAPSPGQHCSDRPYCRHCYRLSHRTDCLCARSVRANRPATTFTDAVIATVTF